MWEGWLEFVPLGGKDARPLISPVESRQPEREHLAYWATGLTIVYAGHYATETLGVQALGRLVEREFGVPWTFVEAPTGS